MNYSNRCYELRHSLPDIVTDTDTGNRTIVTNIEADIRNVPHTDTSDTDVDTDIENVPFTMNYDNRYGERPRHRY